LNLRVPDPSRFFEGSEGLVFPPHVLPQLTGSITITHLIQNFDENIPGMNRAQERQAPVTTEGDEMEMAVPVVTNQSLLVMGRREHQTPTLPKT